MRSKKTTGAILSAVYLLALSLFAPSAWVTVAMVFALGLALLDARMSRPADAV